MGERHVRVEDAGGRELSDLLAGQAVQHLRGLLRLDVLGSALGQHGQHLVVPMGPCGTDSVNSSS